MKTELSVRNDLPIESPYHQLHQTPLWERAQKALQQLLSDAGKNSMIVSVVLTDDKAIQQLNTKWRDKNKATDVLSWPLYEPCEVAHITDGELGDVVISVETAVRQAHARGWELGEELALLLVHGTLHLMGHEDDTEDGSNQMRAIETSLLGKPLDPLPSSYELK
jgi:probable rRNA maturation factor